MIVNIIHLSESQVISLGKEAIESEKIRRQSYLEEMATQRSKFMVWDGIIDKPAFKGINKIHRKIVQYASDNKMESICIMEDDAKFFHPDGLKFFMDNIPEDFDLYFGLLYQGEIGEDNRVLNGATGILSLYIVSESFYEIFLSAHENDHIDRWLGGIAHKHKFYVCNPMVVYQLNGYSFNHRKEMNYDKYLEGRNLFTGL